MDKDRDWRGGNEVYDTDSKAEFEDTACFGIQHSNVQTVSYLITLPKYLHKIKLLSCL